MAIGLVSKRNVGMGKLSIFQCQIYLQGPPSLSVSVWYQPPLQAWSCKVPVCSVKSLNKTKTNLTCCAFHVAVIRRCSALITWHFFPDSQCCQYWLVGLSRAHCRSRMSCRLDRLSADGVGTYWAHLRLENKLMSFTLPWRHSRRQTQGPGVRSVPE